MLYIMNKQEKNLFNAFEEAMQKAMKAYLSSKNGHIENGAGEKYAVSIPICEGLTISTRDVHMTNMLLRFLENEGCAQPRIEGHVILNIKSIKENQYHKTPYFYWISACDYELKRKDSLMPDTLVEFEVDLKNIEFCIRDEKINQLIIL